MDVPDAQEAELHSKMQTKPEKKLNASSIDKVGDQKAEVMASNEFKLLYRNQNRPTKFKTIDWKLTEFYQKVSEKKLVKFNEKKDPKILSYDQVDYSMNLLRYRGETDFKNLEAVKPIFEKAVATLAHIIDELAISFLF